MERQVHWYEHLTVNFCGLALNIASGTLTPVLLPYLVVLFAPVDQKNTFPRALEPLHHRTGDRHVHDMQLGYLVIFAIYGALFVLSTLTLARVRVPGSRAPSARLLVDTAE